MTRNLYGALLSRLPIVQTQHKVAESHRSYHVFTERHLQAMWLEQKYFKNLTLSDGSIIHVVSSGIWNSEAGPDFLKAHIRVDGRDIFGDIELHLSQDGWTQHHHHEDPLYDHVILHVCYWEALREKTIVTSKQDVVPTTFLQPKLTIPESRIIKLIDLDLYPYKVFSGAGRCSRDLFNKISKDQAITFFHSAALWRLQEKWKRLLDNVENTSRCLAGGIATTLGYKQNAEAFHTLFNRLDNCMLLSERAMFSQAANACGFFSAHFQQKWKSSTFYRSLAAEPTRTNSPQDITLKLDHIRPANHPVRRLALLVKIILDPTIDNLGPRITDAWTFAQKSDDQNKWNFLTQQLLDMIPTYEDPYWNRHYTFEAEPQPKAITFIGDSLKREILINVFLPFLYAVISNSSTQEQLKDFSAYYSSLPASGTKKSTYLSHRFFGESQKKLCLSQADSQQGAYQMHKDFCIHFEASCQGCPFVDMYTKSFGHRP